MTSLGNAYVSEYILEIIMCACTFKSSTPAVHSGAWHQPATPPVIQAAGRSLGVAIERGRASVSSGHRLRVSSTAAIYKCQAAHSQTFLAISGPL